MKTTIYALVAVLFATPTLADDFKVHQNNVSVSVDDYSFRYRNYNGKDTIHYQFGYKANGCNFQVQLWENKGVNETRPRFDCTLYKNKTVKVAPRYEYRDIENKDATHRVWGQVSVNLPYKVKLSTAPRWTFDNDGNDISNKFDWWNSVSRPFKIAPEISFVTGVWYILDEDLNKKNVYSTATLKYKF